MTTPLALRAFTLICHTPAASPVTEVEVLVEVIAKVFPLGPDPETL
jgi:hypothetical protein